MFNWSVKNCNWIGLTFRWIQEKLALFFFLSNSIIMFWYAPLKRVFACFDLYTNTNNKFVFHQIVNLILEKCGRERYHTWKSINYLKWKGNKRNIEKKLFIYFCYVKKSPFYYESEYFNFEIVRFFFFNVNIKFVCQLITFSGGDDRRPWE